jgi:hypothetical protein
MRGRRARQIPHDKVRTRAQLPAADAAHAWGLHAPGVEVESYNVEIEDEEGFVGDKASKGAFRDILEHARRARP